VEGGRLKKEGGGVDLSSFVGNTIDGIMISKFGKSRYALSKGKREGRKSQQAGAGGRNWKAREPRGFLTERRKETRTKSESYLGWR